MFAQRAGGDPTQAPDVTGARAITYDNPGYREGEHSKEFLKLIKFHETFKNIFHIQIKEFP